MTTHRKDLDHSNKTHHHPRRSFMKALGVGLGLSLAPRGLYATPRADARRYIFIHAEGGWDPLSVFAPQFDDALIEMEPEAEPMHIGDFALVDGPERPAVADFFTRFGDRTALLNGVSTRSVNHKTCEAVSLTGSLSDRGPDWATLVASAQSGRVTLPHLSLSGPLFRGELGAYVSQARGAFHSLISGDLLSEVEPYAEALPRRMSSSVLDHLRRRAGRVMTSTQHRRASEVSDALGRARQLIDRSGSLNLESEAGFSQQLETATRALASGVCHCVSLSSGGDWDTHTDNSQQRGLFEELFVNLSRLMERLDQTRGPDGQALSETTVVVVTSEMGRTPQYNLASGRDHWPFTSVMLIGGGVRGGQTVGGYREGFTGVGVDPYSLSLDRSRAGISAAELGATLMLLGGVDPSEHLPNVTPLYGLVQQV